MPWFSNIFPCFRPSGYQHDAGTEPLVTRFPKTNPKSDDDFLIKTKQKIKDFSRKIPSQTWENDEVISITKDYILCFFEDQNNIVEIENELRNALSKSKKFEKDFFKTIQVVGKKDLSPEKCTLVCRHMVVLV